MLKSTDLFGPVGFFKELHGIRAVWLLALRNKDFVIHVCRVILFF